MKLRMSLGGKTTAVDLTRSGATAEVSLDGQRVSADVRWLDDCTLSLLIEGRSYELVADANGTSEVAVTGPGVRYTVGLGFGARAGAKGLSAEAGSYQVRSPMPGKIVELLVKSGEHVEAGRGLVVVEAMKMENELTAKAPGIVSAVRVKPGQVVEAGAVLLEVGPSSA